MRNKKGIGIASGLTTILLYVGFVLVLIIFFFLIKLEKTGAEVRIDDQIQNADLNYMMLSYLRTPYTLEGKRINMADFIRIYVNEKNKGKKETYRKDILRVTKEIFDPREFCYIPPGISDKAIVGYGVYILDKETYNDKSKLYSYSGSLRKKEKKFITNNFQDSRVDKAEGAYLVLPSNADNLIYLGFFRTVTNIFLKGDNIKGIPGCG